LINVTVKPPNGESMQNGIEIIGGSAVISGLNIENSTFIGSAISITGNTQLDNAVIRGNSTGNGAVYVDMANLSLTGNQTNISANTNTDYSAQVTLGSEVQMTIGSGVPFSCNDVAVLSKTASCN
jgi:NDP-sugar pyrophosphorylase family protein